MGLVYAVRVTLQKQDIMVNGRLLPLGPGMAASAEVKTGLTERSVVDVRSAARNVNKRLIEFILSPLLRYRDEAMRER